MNGDSPRAARVVVIGGGLAGMTAAWELQKQGIDAIVLEASARLGGKAGADFVDGHYEEHGYHIFPAWYVNARRILRELDVPLNDLGGYCFLRRDGERRLERIDILNPLSGGLLPLPDRLLFGFAALELAASELERDKLAHRISATGFLASRWYATRSALEFNDESMLKAVAVAASELSAYTAQTVGRNWAASPAPFVSVLRENMQIAWIERFAARLRCMGSVLHTGAPVTRLVVRDGRIAAAVLRDGREIEGDAFVVATPVEVTRVLLGEEILRHDPELGRLHKLVSMPMAALHLYFRRRLPDMPREHVFLSGGLYGLSFIDLSQHWPAMPNTALSFIAADFAPLASLSREGQFRALFGEIAAYLKIGEEDLERWHLQPNVDAPLLLATPSSWHDRPTTRTRIPNLMLAGDYVRHAVDLPTMEGAVCSGMSAAAAILDDHGVAHDAKPRRPRAIPRLALRAVAALLRPATPALYAWARIRALLSAREGTEA
jgi:phytoene dehydrogenase-like protein